MNKLIWKLFNNKMISAKVAHILFDELSKRKEKKRY